MLRTASSKNYELRPPERTVPVWAGITNYDWKTIAFMVFPFVLLFSCTNTTSTKTENLPYYNTPDFTPHWINDHDSVEIEIKHTIADFSFTDQDGKQITNKDIEGKIHVADFFFTSCGSICPKMTTHMKRVQSAFENDDKLVLLSYSVTPWLDSVSRLKRYANNKGIKGGKWHLLTGKKSEIYTLARQSYFAEEETGFSKDSTEFLHTEHFILVDQNGRIRGIYNGTLALETDRLIADISLLKK